MVTTLGQYVYGFIYLLYSTKTTDVGSDGGYDKQPVLISKTCDALLAIQFLF